MALLLSVCLALGRDFCGLPAKRSKVLFYSAEDGADILRYRLHRICASLDARPADLDGWLHVLDMSDADPVMYHKRGGGMGGEFTPTYRGLREQVDVLGVDVLVVDNASDVYDASEVNRGRVREFIRGLRALVRHRGGVVILLAHVDKGTAKGSTDAEGYSGSTAWHNSVRSRLFLSTTDKLVKVEHQKSNHGPKADPLVFRWTEGVPAPVPAADDLDDGDAPADADAAAILHLLADSEVNISPHRTARNNAYRRLAGVEGYPRRLVQRDELFKTLDAMEARGWIARSKYVSDNRKPAERWVVTGAGRGVIGASP